MAQPYLETSPGGSQRDMVAQAYEQMQPKILLALSRRANPEGARDALQEIPEIAQLGAAYGFVRNPPNRD